MDNLFDPQGPLGIRTLVDGTDLITSGGVESQPSQFLISESMDRLVGTLKSVYEVIILDTPPAGVFQDAMMLARHAGERVLVAREGVAPVTQVKAVIEEFNKSGIAFQGLVLNGFLPKTANKKLAYGYKASAKGYGYGAATDAKKPASDKVKAKVMKPGLART